MKKLYLFLIIYLSAIATYSQVVLSPADSVSIQKGLNYHNAMIAKGSTDPNMYKGRADLQLLMGDSSSAFSDYSSAIGYGYGEGENSDSTSSDVFVLVGEKELSLGNNSIAVQRFDKALEFNPNNGAAYVGKGKAQLAIGQQSAACESFAIASTKGAKVAALISENCE